MLEQNDLNQQNIHDVTVSVIIPVRNGEPYLNDCFQSILSQTLKSSESNLAVEVSVFDDGSTDTTDVIIQQWKEKFAISNAFSMTVTRNSDVNPKGVGFAKNRAVEQSTGEYLCFCDADDVMEPTRIVDQFNAAIKNKEAIIGSQFTRLPEDSTKNFTFWANNLTDKQLYTQIFQSFGPTLVMPTWFCHRKVFDRVDTGFHEGGAGVPEDLIFFYQHLNLGGMLQRVDKSLMVYRYHPNATTFSIKEETIWETRLNHFQKKILSLPAWSKFSIYGAGKLGRRFFRSLQADIQHQVQQFCDIDPKKVRQRRYEPYPNPKKFQIPIVHYEESIGPYVVCIKTEFTWDSENPFQKLVQQRNLIEGQDFFYFN